MRPALEDSLPLPYNPIHMDKKTDKNDELTDRENEVLRCLKNGRTSRDIGDILGISERTVKFHLGNIFRKFGVGSRAQAVAAAMEKGLID